MSAELDYTPEIEEVIQLAIEQRLFDLNVALPVQVVTFDKAKQTCSVQPCLQRSYKGKPINLPVIQNVPVVFPKAASWSISGPINPGDTGQVIFSQRSLDIWKAKGGVVDPKDPRKFHITDAVFYPGLSPSGKTVTGINDNLRFVNGTTVFELTPNGKMKFQGTDEFLDLMIQIATQLIKVADKLSIDTTNTMLGPQPLLNAAEYATVKSDTTAIKTKIQGIKV